jgi:hypothetical protein
LNYRSVIEQPLVTSIFSMLDLARKASKRSLLGWSDFTQELRLGPPHRQRRQTGLALYQTGNGRLTIGDLLVISTAAAFVSRSRPDCRREEILTSTTRRVLVIAITPSLNELAASCRIFHT